MLISENPERQKEKKKILLERLFIVVFLLGLAVTAFFIILTVYQDWSRINDMKKIQGLLKNYYEENKTFPEFEGVLTGEDPVNQALKKSGFMMNAIKDPKSGSQKGKYEYYYIAKDSSFLIKYCLATNFFKKVGKKGCDNQVFVSY